jgi:hypothetical protein
MNALVPILVAVFNALAALGPKVIDLFAQVKTHPDLSTDGAKLLDGIEKNIEGHLKYLDEREKLKPNEPPVPDPDPTPNHRGS